MSRSLLTPVALSWALLIHCAALSAQQRVEADLLGESTAKVTGIYSDMEYNDEGGDVLGTEIFVVFSRQGYYVVFQSAEGEPGVPVVVKANVDGEKISFELPREVDPHGRFTGEISKDELLGSFAGDGQKTLHLKRKPSYWQ